MAAWHGERGSVKWPLTLASLAALAAAVSLDLFIIFRFYV